MEGQTIRIKGTLMDFKVPKVMAILNITPDSFYKESRFEGEDVIYKRLIQIINEGADIIDVGGCSTRPGSTPPDAKEEWQRVESALKIIRKNFPDSVVSVDTWRAEIAERAVRYYEADIINDVSGGRLDAAIWNVASRYNIPYVLTHSRGDASDMHKYEKYDDVVAEVTSELAKTLCEIRNRGVNDVIIDPGFGFAKNPSQSLLLLNNLDMICRLDCPVLAALSRKSMIWKSLSVTPEESLGGTIALNAIALDRGASIIRVHDVKAAKETVRLISKMKGD